MPTKTPRRAPYCGAPTPMPDPSRIEISLIEQIDDVEADRDALERAVAEFVAGPDIHREIGRHMPAIGRGAVLPEPCAIEHVRAQPRAVPAIGRAGRRGHCLVVVEMDVVRGDIGEVCGIELELARFDVLAERLLEGEVGIGGKAAMAVIGGELDAVLLALGVVERRQDDRRAELAFVDQMAGELVIAVDAEGKTHRRAVAKRRCRNSPRARPWACRSLCRTVRRSCSGTSRPIRRRPVRTAAARNSAHSRHGSLCRSSASTPR